MSKFKKGQKVEIVDHHVAFLENVGRVATIIRQNKNSKNLYWVLLQSENFNSGEIKDLVHEKDLKLFHKRYKQLPMFTE